MSRAVLAWFGFSEGGHGHGAGHHHRHHHGGGHGHGEAGHGHTHGVVDPSIATTEVGLWAVKWSFVILAVTAALQMVVVFWSGSVALLADTIHNIGDATTALPLGLAFLLARRPPSKTFNYGLGRVEDIAGIVIVLIILASAVVAFLEAISRLVHPHPVTNLGWLALAGVIGFLGNEAVAVFRIRTGRRIDSAALVADGYHARTDGLTSLAVVLGAIGVWVGFPLADPIIGLLITVAILGIVWQSASAVLRRMLDGVEPSMLDEITHAAGHVPGIERVASARARWIGHRLHAEITIAVDDGTLLASANAIAGRLREELHEHIPALAEAHIAFAGSDGHHHAPDPVQVLSRLARGVIEIVDTPEGERMRLRVSRHAEGLAAVVEIARAAGPETLALEPFGGDHHCLQSRVAPAEPHEFKARLRLAAGTERDDIGFAMHEDHVHHHAHA